MDLTPVLVLLGLFIFFYLVVTNIYTILKFAFGCFIGFVIIAMVAISYEYYNVVVVPNL